MEKATVQERVRRFVRYKGLSVSEFCRTLDVSSSYVSSMSKSMSLKMIQRISGIYPELNILWLQTGEGEMIKRQEEEAVINLHVDLPCRECDRKDGKIELLQETVRDLQKQLTILQNQLNISQNRLNEMEALYSAAADHCDAKKEKGGGCGDDVPSSLLHQSLDFKKK